MTTVNVSRSKKARHIASTVKHIGIGKGRALGIVDDEMRPDRPKQNRMVCQIFADVSNARVVGKALARVKEIEQNSSGRCHAVCRDAAPNLSDFTCCLRRELELLHAAGVNEGRLRLAQALQRTHLHLLFHHDEENRALVRSPCGVPASEAPSGHRDPLVGARRP